MIEEEAWLLSFVALNATLKPSVAYFEFCSIFLENKNKKLILFFVLKKNRKMGWPKARATSLLPKAGKLGLSSPTNKGVTAY
jgi:hypothetical protein